MASYANENSAAEAGSALTEARKRTLTDQQKKDPEFRDMLEWQGPQTFALKILKKSEIIRLKQTEHVKQERNLLLDMNHPFIEKAYRTYADERNLYLLSEYVPGGELLSRCRARDSTPRELITGMLGALPGMSSKKAAAVVAVYSTLSELGAADPKALAAVVCGGRKLGPALAARVKSLW